MWWRRNRWKPITSAEPGQSQRIRRRERQYLLMMGVCMTLIILAWFVVRLYSTTAAIVMSALALAIPPVAAVVANRC